jgi:type I restriction enzyme S subunit
MNAQQLKNAILQEAIEGRLVPQDPNDEPASILLERIRKEKARLVKEKRITLSKPEKACVIKEEGEFPLPHNWKWGMVNDICRVFGRIGFRGYTKDDLRFSQENAAISISPSNMINGTMFFSNCTYISEEKYEESPEIKIHNGDILIVKTGSSYGKTSLVENLPWKSTINPQIAVIKDVKVNRKYLVYFFQSPFAQSKFKDFVLGTSIPTFSQLNLISMQIPLPPLSEQQRIVAKIEKLLPKVEEYGKAQDELNKLNEELPERLKKSILQEAIEGRLVPQDPNDEPASVLLQKIREEKQQLVKEGKLKKKDLEEKPISEDEIPFEIPDSWEWVRLRDILSLKSGECIKINSLKENSDFPVYGGNGINGTYDKFNVEPETLIIGRVGFYCGSIHKTLSKAWVTDNALIVSYTKDLIYVDFLKYALRWLNLSSTSNSTAQPVVSGKGIYPLLFPLPPLAEQKRIVAKIEQLLGEIEKLKK